MDIMNRKYRSTIIAANWKMNKLPSEVKAFAEAVKPVSTAVSKRCDVIICPPFVALPAAVRAFRDGKVAVGAQNLNENESGAYTGEVSASQLVDLGVRYVIIGHSERRSYYGETDATVNKKIHMALRSNLRPIVCVGESLEQREMDTTSELVAYQLKSALAGVPAAKMRRVVIAYEPIWAIGTGKTATPQEAGAVCSHIRAIIRKLYGARVARAVSILYGGSMNEKNARDLLAQPDIDGGLIGTSSLNPAAFASILETASCDYD
jgi:triosephosphate isomerase